MCTELEHHAPGTCGALCTLHVTISFNMATLEEAYYYHAHFTDEKTDIKKSKQWSKDSKPGALRSRAHALWLKAGGWETWDLGLIPSRLFIHWSLGQW